MEIGIQWLGRYAPRRLSAKNRNFAKRFRQRMWILIARTPIRPGQGRIAMAMHHDRQQMSLMGETMDQIGPRTLQTLCALGGSPDPEISNPTLRLLLRALYPSTSPGT